eukprot:8052730-Ditylum_brightwellii.AAC.1
MKQQHQQQLAKITDLVKETKTKISVESIKESVLAGIPEVVQKEMEKQVPVIVKTVLEQLQQQQNNQQPNMYNGSHVQYPMGYLPM